MKQKASKDLIPDVARLIGEMPLCWIVPWSAPDQAMLMPVLLETDDMGDPAAIFGHLPKMSAACKTLADAPRASFLFLGANSLVTPAMAGVANWAPTWNFAAGHVVADVVLRPERTYESVERAVSQLVTDSDWSLDDLGPRLDTLLSAITGFDAAICEIKPAMKLGQDERPEVLASILESLGESPLSHWTRMISAR